MTFRTQTRPNGGSDVRDLVFGWDAIGALLGLVTILISGIVYNASKFEEAARFRNEIAIHVQVNEGRLEALREQVDLRFHEAAMADEQFVRKLDYYQDMGPEVQRRK